MTDLSLVPNPQDEIPVESPAPQMTMFAQYLNEREGVRLLETDVGFCVYALGKEECYIRDIFILPEHRKHGATYPMVSSIVKIAKAAGCKLLTGSVCPTANNSTASIKVLLSHGMRLHSSQSNLIVFIKEIE